jgi:UDP-3-O-[3-hydroxymyristoyl] glucosamine N-acyltransferase
MADPRFFTVAGPFSVSRLAEIAGARPAPGSDPDRLIEDVAPLDAAGPAHVSFLDNRRYVAAFAVSRAGACVVQPDLAARAPAGMALLLTEEPYRAYARIAQAFYPVMAPEAGVSPSAIVDPTARLAPSCRIEPGAVVGARAEIGARTVIGATAAIAPGVVIGEDCIVGAGATISHSLIGNRVAIYPGARIGQDGFGFAMGAGGHLKVPQLGRVIVEDDVEIGANTTIDRGAGPDTVIGAGTKIDNLVQIGHNVRLGAGCVLVAQVGISGSTHLGAFVAAGGQVGITGHLQIGAGARLAAQSGVMRDVEPGGTVAGSPALPAKEFWRQCAALGQLARRKREDR